MNLRSGLFATALLMAGCAASAPPEITMTTARFDDVIELGAVDDTGTATLHEVLSARRSRRVFGPEAVDVHDLGQLLWAGQGLSDNAGHRTAPSAGATYPLELYVVTHDRVGHYLPDGHRLESRSSQDLRPDIADAAFGQSFVSDAPIIIVIAGVDRRLEERYGALASALVDRESGHAAQNILLQAEALELAAAPVGGLDPATVRGILALPQSYEVRYVIPIGHR